MKDSQGENDNKDIVDNHPVSLSMQSLLEGIIQGCERCEPSVFEKPEHNGLPVIEGRADNQDDSSTSSMRTPSFCILDLRSAPSACCLYSTLDTLERQVFQVGQVPVELHRQASGGSTYLVDVSNNQQVRVSITTPERADSTTSSSLASLDILTSRARRIIDQHRLSQGNLHVIDDLGYHVPGFRSMYLICDEDVRQMVSGILDEINILQEISQGKKEPKETPKEPPALPKLDGDTILPPPAVVACPATTISHPKTSYTKLGPASNQIHTKTRDVEVTTTTTVISRQSIAEITWAQERHDSATRFGGQPFIDPSRRSSKASTKLRVLAPPGNEGVDFGITPKDRPEESRPDSGCGVITSFPKLSPRHCTNEWLIPPAKPKHVLETTDDLYQQGVDAHCGRSSRPSVAFIEDEPVKPPHCYRDLFQENPFCQESPDNLLVNNYETGSQIEMASGNPIVSASYHRRSCQGQIQHNVNDADLADGFVPALIEKIRKGGHRLFHRDRSHKSSENTDGGFHTPYNSPDVRSRNSVVREHTIEPQTLDRAGIYEALTGSRLLIRSKHRNTCSEDNRPHVCQDDLLSITPGSLPPH